MQFASLREKIAHESKVRRGRDKVYQGLIERAHAAGMKAGIECMPIPMAVVDELNGQLWRVDDGACGFAWVSFAGNTAFGRWAKKQGIARPHWPSGLCVWVSEFGQSVDRKAAYAGAYARILNDAGIAAYAGSRLD